MQAGKLRKRVTIQTPVAATNGYMEQIVTWSTLTIVWADVRATSGAERTIGTAQQVQAAITDQVEIRYRSDVTAKQRIKLGDRILDIESVGDPDGRRRKLVLSCREVV